ncbi:protein HflC [Aliidongia dinghuensis]|uniref:Protein HflC n=1 Tax=Aliidongia dinghuensis TaxID=1867774 RepID=A0A8J2Z1B8_9PROT|nr:protease modulator HflC [Aliidongia dinghuensis]GGF48526.1 protein HflC [Aliidongia dinghuensis]
MNRALFVGGIVAAAVLLLLAFNALFIVDQTSQALVIQFGRPVREIRQPGLYAKVPLLQNVVFYDRRLLDYEPPAEEVIAADQKRLVVDSYARYRIINPLQFYQSVGSESVMQLRLGATISGTLRRVLGNVLLNALLSPERSQIMANIRDQVADQARSFGIEVVDVRIRRADLPQENSQAIYARMQSERQREANEYRAQGAEQAQGIRARAERDRTVILAEADKQSQILRGQGDAESIKIYADAFGKDPEFFTFYRSLEAYRTAIGPDTTMVLSPTSEFFQYFGQHKAAKP